MYSYTERNLIEHPITYQYSEYRGESFLSDWKQDRNNVIREFCDGEQRQNFDNKKIPDERSETDKELSELLTRMNCDGDINEQMRSCLKLWIKRFGIKKRIYEKYESEIRPDMQSSFHNMELYVKFAEIMATAYRLFSKLPYLNVLLKVVDTLISSRDRLDCDQRKRLCEIIRYELRCIDDLARSRGVEI